MDTSVSAWATKKDGTQLFTKAVKVTEAVVPFVTTGKSQTTMFPTKPQADPPEQD
jgi:hypothetical protein